MADRRTFLTVGAGSALVLALGGGIYRATRAAPPPHAFALDSDARAALAAIVPALLGGAVVATPVVVGGIIERVHHGILGLPLASQKQVEDLFGMLALGPTRRLLTGLSGPWSRVTPAEVQGFLQSWRVSQFGLLRASYGALHDLVLTAWYADPASWDAIGYPGPKLERVA